MIEPQHTDWRVTDAASLHLEHEALAPETVRAGAPTTGLHELGRFHGVEVGVWEMTAGTATDVEADEIFVVLSGRGTVEIVSPRPESFEVGPGSIVRLDAGMHTVWTITETLRKVYLTPA